MLAKVIQIKKVKGHIMWRPFIEVDGKKMHTAEIPNIDSYNFPEFALMEEAASSTDAMLVFTNDVNLQLQGNKTDEYGIVFVSKKKTIGYGPIKFQSGVPVGYGIMRRDDLKLPAKNLPGEKMTGSTSESIKEALERTERFAYSDRETNGSIKSGHLWFGYENTFRANWQLVKCESSFPTCFEVKRIKNQNPRSSGDAWDAAETLFTIQVKRGTTDADIESAVKAFCKGLSKEAKAHFMRFDLSLFLPMGNETDTNRRTRVWSIKKGWANVVSQGFGKYKSSNNSEVRTMDQDWED